MSIAYYPHQALSLTSYMTLDNSSPPGLSVFTGPESFSLTLFPPVVPVLLKCLSWVGGHAWWVALVPTEHSRLFLGVASHLCQVLPPGW